MTHWLPCSVVALLFFQGGVALAQTVTSASPPVAASEPVTCLNDPDPSIRCRKVPSEVDSQGKKPIIKPTAPRRAEVTDLFPVAKPVPREEIAGELLQQ